MRLAIALLAPLLAAAAEAPHFESAPVFPLDRLHNHSSSIVELANGDLFACWYRGSGERTADDVRVMAARRPRGAKRWTEPYTLADAPSFPDTNPIVFFDSKQRLWLVWSTILANRWETALTRYRIAGGTGWASDPRGTPP